jgi:hypothetical protein
LYKTGVVVGRANNTTHSNQARRTHNTRKRQKEICVSNPKEIQSIFSFGC